MAKQPTFRRGKYRLKQTGWMRADSMSAEQRAVAEDDGRYRDSVRVHGVHLLEVILWEDQHWKPYSLSMIRLIPDIWGEMERAQQ